MIQRFLAGLGRGFHRYVGLVVSLQIMLWSLSGFLMAFWNFGDLYTNPAPVPLALEQVKLTPADVKKRISDPVTSLELIMLADQPFYRITSKNQPVQLMDQQGQMHSPISPALAAKIAKYQYLGSGLLQTIDLLPTSEGNYFSSQPVFRARFDDAQKTEIYLDPRSGNLLARRKALWSWYNRMWEFHLMKYSAHAATNKILLLSCAVLSFLVSLTGIFKFLRWF